jgi:hypothetical protein
MKYDPQLHLLRTVANSIEDQKERQEAVSARFNLYAALEADDRPLAHNWLDALEAAIATAPNVNADSRLFSLAHNAINAIRRGLNASE